MNTQNSLQNSPSGRSGKVAAGLATAAIIFPVLALLGSFLGQLAANHRMLSSSLFMSNLLPNYITKEFQLFLLSLFLPVCLLLLVNNSKKSLFGKLFLILSFLTLAVQLLCALMAPVLSFLHLYSNFLNTVVFSVPGSSLLSGAIAFFRIIFNGSWSVSKLILMLGNLLNCGSSLLSILATLLSVIGFAVLGFSKK